MKVKTHRIHSITLTLLFVLSGLTTAQAADPLPSWNDGSVKQSIVGFVTKVTTPGSAEFVPPAERIATVDNEGSGRDTRLRASSACRWVLTLPGGRKTLPFTSLLVAPGILSSDVSK